MLVAAQAYVLYVTPFEFHRGHPIVGVYVVTGDVGQFRLDGNGMLHRALRGMGDLPTTLTLAQVQDASH